MKDQKQRVFRQLAVAALLFSGMWSAQAHQDQCAGVQDSLQRAQCYCLQGQQNYSDGTSAILAQQSQVDPYLVNARNTTPGATQTYGASSAIQSQIAQGCYGMTKSAFDSIFSSMGSVFGIDLGSLLGGLANQAEGQLCQQVNNAIMSRTQISCPRVSIPGFPISCNGNVSLNSNGIQTNGGVQVGGWNSNGSGTVGANGVYNGNGSVYMGQGNSGTIYTNGNAATGQTGTQQSTGVLSTISKNVGCWFSGGPGC